jgi:hypothetical protein
MVLYAGSRSCGSSFGSYLCLATQCAGDVKALCAVNFYSLIYEYYYYYYEVVKRIFFICFYIFSLWNKKIVVSSYKNRKYQSVVIPKDCSNSETC